MVEEAVRWLREAGDHGHASSLLRLGLLYASEGRWHDPPQARATLSEAATLGLPAAQYELGVMLADGRGGERDLAMAVRWLSEAADAGHEEAGQELQRILADPDYENAPASETESRLRPPPAGLL